MSFDLLVFDNDDLPANLDDLEDLLESEDVDDDTEPTPRLQHLLTELEQRWPIEDEASPWADEPLWCAEACTGGSFAIRSSHADDVRSTMIAACARLGLVLYDPQAGELIHPPAR